MFEAPKKDKDDERKLPEEVLDRLQGYAEANGVSIDEAIEKFEEYLKETFAVSEWHEEDDDFLIEVSEGMVVQKRSGGGMKTTNFVGMFVGVDPRSRDKRERVRNEVIQAYMDDSDKAINAGLCAEVIQQDGVWALRKADGIHPTEEPTDKVPWFVVDTPAGQIALLQTGNWSSKGEPIYPELHSRFYYFLGNEESDFGSSIKLWRLDSPHPTAYIDLYQPCRVKVVPNDPNREVNPDFADILRLPKGWHKEVSYTTDFVDAELVPQLSPEKFCVNPAIHQHHISLVDSLEYYHANLKEVAGLNPIGPLVVLKGKVTSLFKEGWDNDYDETGKVYNLRFTSWDLQKEYPSGMRSEMQAIIGGNLVENFHAFDFNDEGTWRPYAERSTVLVFGRLKVRQTENDGEVPQITAFGVYAVPRYTVPAADGGNHDASQFD